MTTSKPKKSDRLLTLVHRNLALGWKRPHAMEHFGRRGERLSIQAWSARKDERLGGDHVESSQH